jgi:ribosome maturation factor RimP
MRAVPEIEHELERRIEDLGYELVELRWGGSGKRPILKLRIDRSDTARGQGVTVGECATVSRALESWLDEYAGVSSQYVLEISSPGVDRPIARSRDFERFKGETVAVQGKQALRDKATRLEGELLGLVDVKGASEVVLLRLPDGEEVSIPREAIRNVRLVFTWK